jgi:transcriptional regulator with XRE-family HTH domain
MRRRRGFSQEQLAAQVGVGQPAVARWERGDRLPSSEQMQSLCYALGARDDELIVLTRGRFTESPTTEPVGREEKQACLLKSLMWHHYNRPEMDGGGSELEYLILERKAWKLATQDDSARPMLARILAYHADSMRNQERWLEAASLASRALALIPRPDRELDVALRAGAVSAAAAVYRGSAVAPERGVKLLQPWLARTNPPDYRAWIMSDMAEYMAMGGYIDEARALAEAHIQVGNRPEASKWLENAREVIDTFDHERLRPRAAMLARRL